MGSTPTVSVSQPQLQAIEQEINVLASDEVTERVDIAAVIGKIQTLIAAGNSGNPPTVTDLTTLLTDLQNIHSANAIDDASLKAAEGSGTVTPPPVITIAPLSGVGVGINAPLNGWIPFAPGSFRNQDVSSSPVDPTSATIISALTGMHIQADNSMSYEIIDSSVTPLAVLTLADPDDSDLCAVAMNAQTEGTPGDGGDDHCITVDKALGIIAEAYQYNQAAKSAYSVAIFDTLQDSRRLFDCGSTDAAGLSIFDRLCKWDEANSGTINHGFRLCIPNTQANWFIPPANHMASVNTSPSVPMMGTIFRLKASFDVSGFSTINQTILNAMKKYGLMVADNGGTSQIGFFQVVNDSRWTDDIGNLKSVTLANFDVVTTNPPQNHAVAPTGGTGASITSLTAGTPANGKVTLTVATAGSPGIYTYIKNGTFFRGVSVTIPYTSGMSVTVVATNYYGQASKSITIP